MSAGAVFQEALRILNCHYLPLVTQRDLLAAMEAGRPGPLAFLYEAGVEARLPHQKLLRRAAAIYLGFCAANLADDLSDGECSYFSEPYRIGPCSQLILLTLFFHTLLEADLPRQTLSVVTGELIAAVGPQHIEVRTTQWSAPVFREVAEGIAGRQWSAYLQILWCDTWLASRAATIGMNVGLAAHITEDIRSGDPRYTTLPEADKHEVMAWAVVTAQVLRVENLRCLDALLRGIDPILEGAL